MKKLLITLTALSLVLTSCEKETLTSQNQQEVKSYYKLVFDEETNITTVSATFSKYSAQEFENSPFATTIELSGSSHVTFNNDTLQRTVDGITRRVSYEKRYIGYVNGGNFNWQAERSTSYINAVSIDSIKISIPDTLKMDTLYNINWNGKTIQNGDIAEFSLKTINLVTAPDAIVLKYLRQLGSNNVAFNLDSYYFQDIGDVVINLKRTRTKPLLSGTGSGGNVVSVYKSARKYSYVAP